MGIINNILRTHRTQWQQSSTTTVRRVADSRSASLWSKEGSISRMYRLHSPPAEGQKEKWIELGGNTTTNVPMLETADGKTYTQSSAVLRYAARKGSLYPADEETAYAVDNMIAAVDDFRTAAYKPIFPALMGAPDAASIADFKDNCIPLHFGNFERILGDKDYFCGDSVTVADMTMFDVLNNFSFNLFPSVKANFEKLSAFYDRIAALPNVSAYMASEKYTALMAFPCLE